MRDARRAMVRLMRMPFMLRCALFADAAAFLLMPLLPALCEVRHARWQRAAYVSPLPRASAFDAAAIRAPLIILPPFRVPCCGADMRRYAAEFTLLPAAEARHVAALCAARHA